MRGMVRAVREGAPLEITPEDALSSLAVALRASANLPTPLRPR